MSENKKVTGFKICTVGWQCAEFMQWTFDSLTAQNATDWEIAIVYDPSTDKGDEIIRRWCEEDPEHRHYRINTEKKFAPRNQYEAIHEMLQPGDDDVIVYLDLDGDKLSHPEVLNTLRSVYETTGCYLTYGQYKPFPDFGTSVLASAWPKEVVDSNRYRKHTLTSGCYFNHLRTVKGKIYNSIPIETFKWSGRDEWYEGGTDYVTMLSSLELAGGLYQFIPDVLLDYNHANPRADNKTHPKESSDCTLDFLRRRPFEPLNLSPHDSYVTPRTRSKMNTKDLFLPAEERRNILKEYGRRYKLTVFVETGTDQAATPWALKDDFAQLYTIELGHRQWQSAMVMFRDYPHVMCLNGDSGVEIRKVLERIQQPALFWLDGHHSGPGTARGELDTPVAAELQAIFASDLKHVILVDDARCFDGGAEHHLEPHYQDYPSLQWVEELANSHGYDYLLQDDIMRLTPRETG